MLHGGLWGLARLDYLLPHQFREVYTQATAIGQERGIRPSWATIPSTRFPSPVRRPLKQPLVSLVEDQPAKPHPVVRRYSRDTQRRRTVDWLMTPHLMDNLGRLPHRPELDTKAVPVVPQALSVM